MGYLDAALAEFQKQSASGDGGGKSEEKAQRVLARCFRQQRDLIGDNHRFKALLCPRRAGKTIAALACLLVTAFRRSRTESVYVAGTRAQAKQVLWDYLLQWNEDLELALVFNLQELQARAPNGSKITLGGAETEADVERYRGRRYALFVIDEPASLRPAILDGLILKVVSPALQDHKGTLLLTGTPGHILSGMFYRVTGPGAFEVQDGGEAVSNLYGKEPAGKFLWSVHTWTVADNSAMPEMWAEALETKRRGQLSDDNPIWLREGLGRWATDDTKLVYNRFDPQRNTWKPGKRSARNPFGLPEDHGDEWRYVIGMDMGRSIDPFALTVAAFSDTSPRIYQVYEWQAWKVLPKDIAAAIQKITDLVPIEHMVCDWGPFGKMVQEQLLKEHGFPVEDAEKKSKLDYIELLNGDYVDERAYLLEDGHAAQQALYLSYDDTGIKEATDRSAEGRVKNDCLDAWLYTWRWVRHHFAVPAAARPPAHGTPAHLEFIEQQRMADLAEKQEALARLGQGNDYYDDAGGWE